MGAMVSHITSFAIIYSTVYSGADQRKHQSFASLVLCGEFTGDRWIPHTNGQQRGKWFHLMTASCNIYCIPLHSILYMAVNKNQYLPSYISIFESTRHNCCVTKCIWDAISHVLWRHQQNVNRASERQSRYGKFFDVLVIYAIIMSCK